MMFMIVTVLSHDVAECIDGDVVVGGSLEGLVVLVVLDNVLEVADQSLEEVGHVVAVVAVEWLTETTRT